MQRIPVLFGLCFIILMICAAGVQAAGCDPPHPVKINVTPSSQKIEYDTGQSLAAIQGQADGAPSPYGFHANTYTQGFMNGLIRMTPSVKLGGFTSGGREKTGCLWFDEINVKVEIAPKIVIAREVNQDLCMRQAVLAHEMKHVQMDRKMVNEFSEVLAGRIYSELKKKGFKAGPFPADQKNIVTKKMQETVFQLVREEYAWMAEERTRAQSAVDTRKEYERVSAQCPAAQERLRRSYRRP